LAAPRPASLEVGAKVMRGRSRAGCRHDPSGSDGMGPAGGVGSAHETMLRRKRHRVSVGPERKRSRVEIGASSFPWHGIAGDAGGEQFVTDHVPPAAAAVMPAGAPYSVKPSDLRGYYPSPPRPSGRNAPGCGHPENDACREGWSLGTTAWPVSPYVSSTGSPRRTGRRRGGIFTLRVSSPPSTFDHLHTSFCRGR
jgi:hypothetical protein